jgi:hypothetical protein
LGNQVDFTLGWDAGGEEGKAPIGSVARVNPKVTLAERAICQCNDCWEFGGGRKGIQSQEDLTPGGTRCCQVDVPFVRQWWEGGLVHRKNAIRRQIWHSLGQIDQGRDITDGVSIELPGKRSWGRRVPVRPGGPRGWWAVLSTEGMGHGL